MSCSGLLLILFGCGDSAGPDLGPSPFVCSPNPNPTLDATGSDARNLLVEGEQPGFAGLWLNGDKIDVAVAAGFDIDVDGYRASIIDHIGFRVFERQGGLRSMNFVRVLYPWSDLVLAKNKYGDCVFFTEGVVSISISESKNRVVVGVVDQVMAAHVLRFVADDVEKFIVEIELLPPPVGLE